MTVLVKMIGRLGNNLFQYGLGRIIAERLGMELSCVHLPVGELPLEVTAPTRLAELREYFPNAPLHIAGQSYELPIESLELQRNGAWTGHRIDLPAILRNREARQIRLLGWFQRFEYYASHREDLRRWFMPPRFALPFNISKKDIVVNIRRGKDYQSAGWTLPLGYYKNLLSSLPNVGKVYLCGTCIDHVVLSQLREFKPTVFDASPIQHFSFIGRFDRILLSNSTFAWWAAFLSDAHEIFAPRSSQEGMYAFSGFGDVDLNMRHSRYREVLIP